MYIEERIELNVWRKLKQTTDEIPSNRKLMAIQLIIIVAREQYNKLKPKYESIFKHNLTKLGLYESGKTSHVVYIYQLQMKQQNGKTRK